MKKRRSLDQLKSKLAGQNETERLTGGIQFAGDISYQAFGGQDDTSSTGGSSSPGISSPGSGTPGEPPCIDQPSSGDPFDPGPDDVCSDSWQ